MPTNKKALTRYLVYDRCLRNYGRRYDWEDLVEEVNVTLDEEGLDGIGKTTFYKDIAYMVNCEWKAPIERYREGHRIFYRYSDPDFSITKQPMSSNESLILEGAVQVLSRMAGMPQFEWVHEIIPMLEQKTGIKSDGREIIYFDTNLDYTGLKNIQPLYNAIVNRRALQITYQDFRSPSSYQFTFHPYHLREYNNRWFVFGLNVEKSNPTWNLALDRIIEVKELSIEYIDTNTEWADYFYDVIGVTMPESVEKKKIILKCNPSQSKYLLSKPLHPSMKIITNDTSGLVFSIEIIPNEEFRRVLLSFGSDIEIKDGYTLM